MTAPNKKDDYIKTLAKCQMKLFEINEKLVEIKKRHCKMDNLFPNKGGRKQKARLEENYSLLKEEAELLERDIAFVRSLMECGNEANRSLTARIMKKVIPGRMFDTFGRETSEEFKASIMSHSTRFLEKKVISLETSTKRSKKTKLEDQKLLHRVLDNPSISKSGDSSSSSKCKIKIDNKALDMEEGMMQNSKQSSVYYENDNVVFNNELCTDNSVFTLHNIEKHKVMRKRRKQKVNELESAEKFAQTENIGCFQRSSSIESLEKCVQTDEFQISYMNPEICEALKKVFDECAHRERIQQSSEDTYEDSLSYNLSESSKGLNQSADKSFEICNEWHELVLPSVLSCLQNKNNYSLSTLLTLDSNDVSKFIEEIENYPGVNHQSYNGTHNFSQAIRLYNAKGRRKLTRVSCLQSQYSYFPEIWFVRECVSVLCILQYDFTHQAITKSGSLLSASNGVSVQVIRKQSKHEPLRSTLEIDYSHNANTSGRIVLTEFGSDQCMTQTEIFGRIVTYLLGLKTTTGNT